MLHFERILKKVIFFQIIFLIISQWILSTEFSPYLNKLSYYEGVTANKTEVIETWIQTYEEIYSNWRRRAQ